MFDYEKALKLVDCEIDKITTQPELNDASLSNLYKLADVRKDLAESMEKEMGMNGNSMRTMYGYYDDGVMPRDSNSYRGMNSYGYNGRIMYRDGNSYAMNGRSMNYNGGYSGKAMMFDHLEQAMQEASTEKEREAIRQVMAKLDNN